MSSDNARNAQNDVRFAAVGMGMMIRWQCFGCGQSRPTLGSKGAGINKRCAQCLDKRKAKA